MSTSALETLSFIWIMATTIIAFVSMLGSILFEKTKDVIIFDGVREIKEKKKTFWYKTAVVVAIISMAMTLAGVITNKVLNNKKQAAAAYQDMMRQAKADSINAALITANNEIRNPLLPLRIIIDYSIPLDSFNYNIQHFFRRRNQICSELKMRLIAANISIKKSWDTISSELMEADIDEFLAQNRAKRGPSISRPSSKRVYSTFGSSHPDSILYKVSINYDGVVDFYSADSIKNMKEFDNGISKVGDLSFMISLFENNDQRVADFLIGADFEKSRTIKISLTHNRAYFSLSIDQPLIENKDNKMNSFYSFPNGFLLIDNDLFEKNGFSLDKIQFECGLTNVHQYVAVAQQITTANMQGTKYFKVAVTDLLKTVQLP